MSADLTEALFAALGESNHKIARWSQSAPPFEYWSREEIEGTICAIQNPEPAQAGLTAGGGIGSANVSEGVKYAAEAPAKERGPRK